MWFDCNKCDFIIYKRYTLKSKLNINKKGN